MKCVTYLYQYFTNKNQAFTNALSLPTVNNRINQLTKKQYSITTVQLLLNKKVSADVKKGNSFPDMMDRVRNTMARTEKVRVMWRRLFEECNKKPGEEIEEI